MRELLVGETVIITPYYVPAIVIRRVDEHRYELEANGKVVIADETQLRIVS